MPQCLIIFVKNFIIGKFKTCLAKSIGNEQALIIYKELVSFTLKISSKVNSHRIIYFSEYVEEQNNINTFDFQLKFNMGKI